MNKINRMGDKWPPWGVSDEASIKLDENPITEVNRDLFVKYDIQTLKQFNN